MAFSEELLDGAKGLREKIFRHPFVSGIADGSLDVDRFRFYLQQDYLFLIQYCRVFGLAVAKAADLADMTRLAALLDATLSVEMELHRNYSAQFGVSPRDLEESIMAPTTRAYTDHLLATAWGGGLAEIAASLLPCQWDYWEIGRDLAARGGLARENRYRQWVQTYTAEEFGQLADWIRRLVDREAVHDGENGRSRMRNAFEVSSHYELDFWEMAWSGSI